MEKEFFVNGGIPPQLQYDHHPFISSIPTWHNLSSSSPMEIHHTNTNTNTTDNFESAMSSMVSSPAASNSALSNDNYMIRELIGKLGNICNSGGNHQQQQYIGGGNCSNNNSCYSTPISSPPKMGIQMPIMDHLVKENFPILGNSIDLSSNLPAMPADPGFAERAARFSSFGSRSFSGRTTQFGVNNNNNNNNEFCKRSNSKLQRVLSSPSLNEAEINKNSMLLQNNDTKQSRNCGQNQGQFENSRENSSISAQSPPVVENGSNRKRKAAASKGKSKEHQSQTQSPLFSNTNHVGQHGEDSSAKRSKSEEESDHKTEENRGGEEESKKQSNANQKPPEPPKDYIHVRARRGQATDSHSLAERVRREKISERMKLLQDLVPGCDKVTGKALMLDEIINYVQSLQRQVEFLSMKLSSVNPRLEFNVGNLFSKDGNQPNSTMAHPMYQIDSMAPNQNLYGQTHQQDTITTTAPCSSMDPLNPSINHLNHALHLPSIDGFPQLSSLCEGDLHSIVMGFGQKDNGFHQSQTLHGSNSSPLMKIEF